MIFPKLSTAISGIGFSFIYKSPYGFSSCIFSSISTSSPLSSMIWLKFFVPSPCVLGDFENSG